MRNLVISYLAMSTDYALAQTTLVKDVFFSFLERQNIMVYLKMAHKNRNLHRVGEYNLVNGTIHKELLGLVINS